MTGIGWIQIALFFLAVLALTKPVGGYLYRVFEGPLLFPRLDAALIGSRREEQTWGAYVTAILLFSALSLVVTVAIELLQGLLPFNPQRLSGMEPALAFNTAASFV